MSSGFGDVEKVDKMIPYVNATYVFSLFGQVCWGRKEKAPALGNDELAYVDQLIRQNHQFSLRTWLLPKPATQTYSRAQDALSL